MELAPDSGVYTLVEQTVKGNVDNSIIQNRPSSASVQRGMLPLRLKLAYLRFLSLKHMGINLPANEIGVVNMHLFPSDKMRADPPEEWRIALKEMCRALEMKSPVSIMQRLRVAIQLITRSLETLMDKRRFQPSGYTPSTSSSNVIFWRSRFDSMWPDISLGADELMPAISWALIQTNHPSLDAAVWMCSEFRHHSLHMGEGAYALTQLSSALEFCKEALASSFDIEESLFLKYIRQYDVTQDLIRLCKNGDAAGVASCLADGADINGLTFSQDESPLTAAISENNVDIVELLLSSPLIDVNARIFPFHCHLPATDDEKRSALHDATPLMVAALNGIINIVELLLRKGANRYLTNENGDSATALAFSRGHMKVVRMLLADQANTSLSAALRMRSMFLVEGLLSQSNVNINESSEENSVLGNPPLFDAICTGKLEFVNVIVSHKLIDIHKTNQNRDTALIWCCKSNGEELTDDIRAKIACLLLKMGIVRQAVDINGKTALDLARVSSDNYTDSSWSRYKGSKYPHLATILHYSPVDNHIYSLAKMQDYDGVCALIEQSVDVNSSCPVNSYTALIAAIFNRDIKIIEILLKQPNIDVNKCGKNKMTALHHACEMGYVEGISLLLQAGADRVSRNSLGETPLDCAVRNNNELAADCMRFDPQKISICLAAKHGDWRVMNALLSQGVSINARKKHFVDGAGNTAISHELATPLIAAVAYNQKELVTSLITNTELNVDINATNEIGQSALVYAASLENESMVLFLLKHGANRYLKDNEGHTAYNWASKKGYRAISDILRCDPNVSSVHDAIIAGEIESTIAFFKQDPNPNARWSPRNPMDSTRSQNSEVTSSTTSKLSEGDTPLVVAAKFDKIPLIQLLLRAPDLDINFTDGKGRTALMHASFQGFEPVVLLLLRHKASRQIVDYSNKKAIDYAIKGGFTDIAFILKADPYIVHIHDACERGDVGIVHALLKQGCPPNFGDERSGIYVSL
jgi:ankyrin repeat protein